MDKVSSEKGSNILLNFNPQVQVPSYVSKVLRSDTSQQHKLQMITYTILSQQQASQSNMILSYSILYLYQIVQNKFSLDIEQSYLNLQILMGEIVQLQIGQTGNRIGSQFWKQLLIDHQMDEQGTINHQDVRKLSKIHTFFSEVKNNQYKPRAISIDMDTNSMDEILTSPLANFYRPQNLCYHTSGTHNLWPIGYNGGKEIIEEVMDGIRHEVESCDRFAGFNFVQSLLGGTGSGLTSLILQRIEQSYGYLISTLFSLVPSPNISDSIIEPYNATLALKTINQFSSKPCVLFDNQSFFKTKMKIYERQKLKISNDFMQINKQIGKGIANFTSPMRFPCDGNIGYRKMSTNLIQYPYLKYFVMGMPVSYNDLGSYQNMGNFLKFKSLDYKHFSITALEKNFQSQKWVACYFIFCGNQSSSFDIGYRINTQLMKKKTRGSLYRYKQFKLAKFIQLPHSYIASCVDSKNSKEQNTVTSIQLSSIINQVSNNLYNKVSVMTRKKAYLHWYLAQGMQLEQINEAQSTLLDIASTYQEINSSNDCGGEQEGYDGLSVES